MLGILDRDEKALILAEINSFLKGSGLDALTEHATEEEMRMALGAIVTLSSENALLFPFLKTNSLAYLMIARAKPEQALFTLIQLQSLFTETKTQDFLLRDVLLVAKINGNQPLLENLGYIPEDDSRYLGPQQITVDDELNQLQVAVKTEHALFKLAKSCSSPIQLFNQFTRLDLRGRTFLHLAAINNTLESLITYFPSPELLNSLTQKDYAGQSPLSLMAELHPIERLARVISRLRTHAMRKEALCSLDSEGISLIERCILLQKSPVPLLQTLSPQKSLELLWQRLPNNEITLLQAIWSTLPKDEKLQTLFDRLFTERKDPTPLGLGSNEHFEIWKALFHGALEKNAFVVLEMLAFWYRKLGSDEMLVDILNSKDKEGRNLLHRGCDSAVKLIAVAALYPDIDSLVNAFISRTAQNVTAFQLAFDNNIPATALHLIPANRLSDLLNTRRVDPETGLEELFPSAFSGNVYYNYLESLFQPGIAPSDLEVDSALKSLLTVLICLTASDFARSIQSVIAMHRLKPTFAKALKYKRWGEIQLEDGQSIKHTEIFVNTWYQKAFSDPNQPGMVVSQECSALFSLSWFFPTDVLNDIHHPQPEIEAQHLTRVLLSIIVISRSYFYGRNQHDGYNAYSQIETFLEAAKTFTTLHRKNKKIDTDRILSLIEWAKKLTRNYDIEHHRDLLSCSTSITRPWFYEIKRIVSISEEDSNKNIKLIKHVITHADWLAEQNLFPAEGMNHAVWIFCLQRIFQLDNTILSKFRFNPISHSAELKNILNLSLSEAEKRYLSPVVEDVNRLIYEIKGHHPSVRIGRLSSDRHIIQALTINTGMSARTIFDALCFGEDKDRSLDIVARLPNNYQQGLYDLIRRLARGEDYYFLVDPFLQSFSRTVCRKLLSGGIYENNNSGLKLFFPLNAYAHPQRNFFKIVNEIYKKYFTDEELKVLFEYKITDTLVLDKILYFNNADFEKILELYENDLERLRDFYEKRNKKVCGNLLHLAKNSSQQKMSQAIANLGILYGSYEGVWVALRVEGETGISALTIAMTQQTLQLIIEAIPAHQRWPLLQLPMCESSGPNVFQVFVEQKLNAEMQLSEEAIGKIISMVEVLGCQHRLEALQCTVGGTTLLEYLMFGREQNRTAEEYYSEDSVSAYILQTLEAELHTNPVAVLPMLKRILGNNSQLLNTNTNFKYLFYTVVLDICSGKIGANQQEILRGIVTVFNASLLKENNSWRPVMSVLALLIDFKISNVPPADTVENSENAENKNNKIRRVCQFISDVVDDCGIVKALEVMAALPVAIRKKAIQELLAEKDFAASAIVRCFCDVVTGNGASENEYYFMRELIAYTSNAYAADEDKNKDILLLTNAFQKLIIPGQINDLNNDILHGLSSDDVEDLPGEEVCQSWLAEIYSSLHHHHSYITSVSHPIDSCFSSLGQCLDSYVNRSAKEKLVTFRKTASIFKSVTSEFTVYHRDLLQFILMSADAARFYKFKNYAPGVNSQSSVSVDEAGFFADKKKKGKKSEVTSQPVTDMFANEKTLAADDSDKSDDDIEDSEFSQGKRKERKEKEPMDSASQYQKQL